MMKTKIFNIAFCMAIAFANVFGFNRFGDGISDDSESTEGLTLSSDSGTIYEEDVEDAKRTNEKIEKLKKNYQRECGAALSNDIDDFQYATPYTANYTRQLSGRELRRSSFYISDKFQTNISDIKDKYEKKTRDVIDNYYIRSNLRKTINSNYAKQRSGDRLTKHQKERFSSNRVLKKVKEFYAMRNKQQ